MENTVTRKIDSIDRLINQLRNQQIASTRRYEANMAEQSRAYQQKQDDIEIKIESLYELRVKTVYEYQNVEGKGLIQDMVEEGEREMWTAVEEIEDRRSLEQDRI